MPTRFHPGKYLLIPRGPQRGVVLIRPYPRLGAIVLSGSLPGGKARLQGIIPNLYWPSARGQSPRDQAWRAWWQTIPPQTRAIVQRLPNPRRLSRGDRYLLLSAISRGGAHLRDISRSNPALGLAIGGFPLLRAMTGDQDLPQGVGAIPLQRRRLEYIKRWISKPGIRRHELLGLALGRTCPPFVVRALSKIHRRCVAMTTISLLLLIVRRGSARDLRVVQHATRLSLGGLFLLWEAPQILTALNEKLLIETLELGRGEIRAASTIRQLRELQAAAASVGGALPLLASRRMLSRLARDPNRLAKVIVSQRTLRRRFPNPHLAPPIMDLAVTIPRTGQELRALGRSFENCLAVDCFSLHKARLGDLVFGMASLKTAPNESAVFSLRVMNGRWALQSIEGPKHAPADPFLTQQVANWLEYQGRVPAAPSDAFANDPRNARLENSRAMNRFLFGRSLDPESIFHSAVWPGDLDE